ncbi:histidinol-phosphate transaminase [Shewanella submarina]|uniref:Histidinol-phosphate aminotransferase n=1 Tax=Shewanella submarina TaxID=2016376 RepID=A0ABV7GD11_9GAMM|nr:histidinol-phosphate transaminase [Shewanella submarina]MCL1039087.1 histidinol-phosphate transaminase [Shewanella submarina]
MSADNNPRARRSPVVEEKAIKLAARLARPELLGLEPYQSARRIGGRGDIWVNANESPFNNTVLAGANRYPECQPPALIQAYADYADVPADSIICGRGADEAIELLIRTFCIPGRDAIVTFGPTYGMYGISAATFNVGVTELKLDGEFSLPSPGELAGSINDEKIIFVCNPNNPTGTLVSKEQITGLLTQFPDKLIVVDEAYIEFCPEQSSAPLLSEYPNLVVLRTLSKAFALAGIRCGFMLANPGICELVMRVIAPYPVPAPVADMATAALTETGISTMQTQVEALIANGRRLGKALEQAGATVSISFANFLLAEYEDVYTINGQASQAGIVARRYSHPRLANAIRFSFTNDAETDAIIRALCSAESATTENSK